jgi:hypothetical protein
VSDSAGQEDMDDAFSLCFDEVVFLFICPCAEPKHIAECKSQSADRTDGQKTSTPYWIT